MIELLIPVAIGALVLVLLLHLIPAPEKDEPIVVNIHTTTQFDHVGFCDDGYMIGCCVKCGAAGVITWEHAKKCVDPNAQPKVVRKEVWR